MNIRFMCLSAVSPGGEVVSYCRDPLVVPLLLREA